MLDREVIATLPRIPPPVLTAYLDTNPANPRNQGRPSGARIWLKSRAKEIAADLPLQARKLFRKQVARVDRFLSTRPRRERGIVIVAGPKTWHITRLQVQVKNELHWGRAALKQLLWLLDEHQSSGVSVIDRSGARFYRYWMGEFEEQKAERYELDTSTWRKKTGVRPARLGQRKTGLSSERDAFQQRIDAQYARIFKALAKRIHLWVRREKFDSIVIIGARETLDFIRQELPPETRERVTVLAAEYGQVSASELEKLLAPMIARWKRSREAADVAEIVANRNPERAVLGITETLSALQRGDARALIVSRGTKGQLKQCIVCGWTDRAADPPVCPVCGGERRSVSVQDALPELARKFRVPVEVVAGKAATDLMKFDGLAAWLR
jgi:peptide subunit release factor 1 (eRF1)